MMTLDIYKPKTLCFSSRVALPIPRARLPLFTICYSSFPYYILLHLVSESMDHHVANLCPCLYTSSYLQNQPTFIRAKPNAFPAKLFPIFKPKRHDSSSEIQTCAIS